MKGNNQFKKSIRECWIENHVGMIPLPDGKIAKVDEDRLPEVAKHNWSLSSDGYVRTNILKKQVMLHRLLYPELKQIDHISSNKLDNTASNLRECSSMQNRHNTPRQSDNKSGYKGVSKAGNKWTARICLNYIPYHIGNFNTAIEAAQAYDAKAKELHGDFAKLNFNK